MSLLCITMVEGTVYIINLSNVYDFTDPNSSNVDNTTINNQRRYIKEHNFISVNMYDVLADDNCTCNY